MPESDHLPTPQEHHVLDVDAEIQSRLQLLTDVFLDISEAPEDALISRNSMQFVQHGAGLRRCLSEIIELRGPSSEDLHLKELRSAYIQTLFVKAGLLTPNQRDAYDKRSDELQAEYADAVVDKIARIIHAQTPSEALELGQLPPIVRKASFKEDEPISMEQFTANHLFVLIDTTLTEHGKRREIIDGRQNQSIRSRLATSSGARLAIGTAIGAASLAPEFNFVPRPEEVITHDLELALRGLSGVIIGINLPEFVRLKFMSRLYDKQARENFDKLSDNREICDSAMRIVFGSADYGGSSPEKLVSGRAGTDDKAENMRRLLSIPENFPHISISPGGRTYTARQALGYAARLLIERRDQLNAIIDPSKTAAEQEKLFLELSREIIVEDVRRMKRKLNVTKVRRLAMDALGILPAILFPAATAATSEAATLSRDTFDTINAHSEKDKAD